VTVEKAAADLIELGRAAGDPARELVIAGEGNASAATDAGTLMLTASGARLAG